MALVGLPSLAQMYATRICEAMAADSDDDDNAVHLLDALRSAVQLSRVECARRMLVVCAMWLRLNDVRRLEGSAFGRRCVWL